MNTKTKTKKFVGPSKKMADALEAEGLNITWPKVLNSDSDLAIEGSFYTGCDWEKLVLIDLRDEGDLSTKANVDAAISNQLDEAYENFSIDEEMKLNMEGSQEEREARGVPDAARLLEDMQEQDACLKRFAEVAEAVSSGRPVPSKADTAEITISGRDAKRIAEILKMVGDEEHTHAFSDDAKSFANMIADELTNKVKAA